MKMNGLLIDCSRLTEQHDYYFRLVDFMADWGMNTLVLHFTDDHGCAIRLPGFEDIAVPHAFSVAEIHKLVAHARRRGVEIIPEVESFGHTRYLTDHPRYAHLYAGRKTRRLTFHAVDPLNPDTLRLMDRLIRETARLFPAAYLHIGCDEVNLTEYCRRSGVSDESAVWAQYVNHMIALTRSHGRTPMLWADHLVKSARIAQLVRKDAVLVHWNYELDVNAPAIARLRTAGFRNIVVAPSIACYSHRFLPVRAALTNTQTMVEVGKANSASGVLTTVWCPYRYLQNALYYGIAFAAEVTRGGGKINLPTFHARFAKRVFGTPLAPVLRAFLDAWPDLAIDYRLAAGIYRRRTQFDADQKAQLRKVNGLGRAVLKAAAQYTPATNPEIWQDMVLAAQAAWLCSEWWCLATTTRPGAARIRTYRQQRKEIRQRMEQAWNRTRYADDPQKDTPKFREEADQFAKLLVGRLPA